MWDNFKEIIRKGSSSLEFFELNHDVPENNDEFLTFKAFVKNEVAPDNILQFNDNWIKVIFE